MRVMGESPPNHDAVRVYLDSAVAEAAERWVGRAADATAYADLVAAVLARREALSPMRHLPERFNTEPPPVEPGPRHTERRSRPRWPGGSPPADLVATSLTPPLTPPLTLPTGLTSLSMPPTPAQAWQPRTTVTSVPDTGPVPSPPRDVRRIGGLPTRPPGRHRLPPPPPSPPQAIDLSENLSSVLDWLGRPES
jgi:hypothetical protein